MSRRVLLECDWRGCKHKATADAGDEWPAGWAEFQIMLITSGPMSEGWRRAGLGNTRSVVVCPSHVDRMFRGVPGQQDEPDEAPAPEEEAPPRNWIGSGKPERA